MTTEIKLPRKFYDDHAGRDLPTPVAVRSNCKSVWVASDDADLPELIDDAKHYADPDMRDGWDRYVIPLCYAAERLLSAYNKQSCTA